MKTYPLDLEDEFHKKIQRVTFESNKTIKLFILEAIEEKLQRENQNEKQ